MSQSLPNRPLFEELLSEAILEITERFPSYFEHKALEVPVDDLVVSDPRVCAHFSQHSSDELLGILRTGLSCLSSLGLSVRCGNSSPDYISMLLFWSIFDAYLAATGKLPLGRRPIRSLSIEQTIRRFHYRRTADDARYIISKGSSERVMLLISSTGAPLALWSPLISDTAFSRRYLVVQSRSGPLITGGTQHASRLGDEVSDIAQVIEHESAVDIDVVAWCNGARVALALASECTHRISSVTLISPTFHGAVDEQRYPSPFEDSLPRIYRMIAGNAARAEYLLRCLAQVTPAYDSLPSDPEMRADAILRLPPNSIAKELFRPLETVEQFKNYMQRISDDEGFDIRRAVSQVVCPILLLTGTHDPAINTAAAADVLRQYGNDVLRLTILGAGHHIHILQYCYFRLALRGFISNAPPARALRMDVSRLAGTQQKGAQ
jgi:pimeloyl-ACP methyl ester carboxylesterase